MYISLSPTDTPPGGPRGPPRRRAPQGGRWARCRPEEAERCPIKDQILLEIARNMLNEPNSINLKLGFKLLNGLGADLRGRKLSL